MMPLESEVCFGVFSFSSSTLVCFVKHYSNQSSRQRRESDVRSTAACVTSFHCPIDFIIRSNPQEQIYLSYHARSLSL